MLWRLIMTTSGVLLLVVIVMRSQNREKNSVSAALAPSQVDYQPFATQAKADSQIRGIVVNEDGQPIDGATVTSVLHSLTPVAHRFVQTTHQGEFVIDKVVQGKYSLSIHAKEYIAGKIYSLEVGDGVTEIDHILVRGGIRVHGVVRDSGGGTIGGASVDWSGIIAMANEVGLYELWLKPGKYYCGADHSQYARAKKETVFLAESSNTKDFILQPAAVVEGTVVHAISQEIVPGARIQSPKGSVYANKEGQFRLDQLPSGEIEISALAEGYKTSKPTVLELEIGETKTNIQVLVDSAFSIEGRVETAGHKPIAGAILRLMPGAESQTADSVAITTSDEGGRFRFSSILPGSYHINANAKDFVWIKSSLVNVDNSSIKNVVLTMSGGLTVRGKVEPAMEAQVNFGIRSESVSTMEYLLGKTRVETNEHGDFSASGIKPGNYSVSAHSANATGTLNIELLSDENDLVIPMTKKGTIKGVLLDTRGEPVSDSEIGAQFISPSNIAQYPILETTDQDGQFQFSGLEAGTYKMVAPGYQLATPVADQNVSATKDAHVKIIVKQRDGQIEGLILGVNGEPVVAKIAVEGRRLTVSSNDEGRFNIDGLTAGTYQLLVTSADSGEWQRLIVNTGEPALTIQLNARTEIRVSISSDFPLVGRVATNLKGPIEGWGQSFKGKTRTFIFKNLPQGDYDIYTENDRGTAQTTIQLSAGQTKEISLALKPPVSIRGRVIDSKRRPATDTKLLTIYSKGSFKSLYFQKSMEIGERKSLTNSDGYFEVPNMYPGEYELSFFGSHGHKLIKVNVESGDDLNLGDIIIDAFTR